MTIFEIPLRSRAQKIKTEINGLEYGMFFRWNKASNCWIMDISNSDDTPLLSGVPLITGADLLEQFEYLGLGVKMVALTIGDIDAVPTFDNAGVEGKLFFAT